MDLYLCHRCGQVDPVNVNDGRFHDDDTPDLRCPICLEPLHEQVTTGGPSELGCNKKDG